MIFKLGLKELRRNIFINILCTLQLSVIFVVVIAMVSSVVSRFEKYLPFKEELNQKGVYLQVDQMIYENMEDNLKYPVYSKEVIKNDIGLTKVKNVFCFYDIWVRQESSVIAYDNETISKYTPEMESGQWLSEKKALPEGVIAGVISENNDNINTGDVIELNEAFSNESIKVYIVGKIADGSAIIGTSQAERNDYTCDNLYRIYDFTIEKQPLLIINHEDLLNTNAPFMTQVRGSVIINYEDNISEEEVEANYNTLMRNGSLFYGYSTLDDMHKNSIKYIYFEVLRLLPMIISIFILTAISILSISAVNAKLRIKTYAVYYICGMQWKDIIKIEIIKSNAIVLISGLISYVLSLFADKQVIFGGLIIQNGFYQIISCAFVGLLFIILSIVFPFVITKKEKPVTVFHSN